MKVTFTNNETGDKYDIKRLLSHDIETTLDIPADHFSLTLGNPLDKNGRGLNADLFKGNDRFTIKQGEEIILKGIADDVFENSSNEENTIEITGRDLSLELLENDAEPKTFKNIKLSSFINQQVSPFGLKANVNPKHDKTIKEIVIEVGDSIWDAIFREVKELDMWIWCNTKGEIIVDKLNYQNKPVYYFSNQSNKEHIRISNVRKRTSGADIVNEVWVRGHGEKSFMVKHKDPELTKVGYRRRRIIEDGDADTEKKALEVAKNFIEDRKRGSFEIEFTISGDHPVLINNAAKVIYKPQKIDGVFFIVGIIDKSSKEQNEKVVRVRPLWEGL